MCTPRRIVLSLSLAIVVLLHTHAFGIFGIGDLVNDPINLVQNTFTAARSLQSNMNEVVEIKNQVEQLLAEARNLIALPEETIAQAQGLFQQYYDLLRQGQNLWGEVQQMTDAFEQLYGAAANAGQQGWLQRATLIVNQVRRVGALANRTQQIYPLLLGQQRATQQMLLASQAAVGNVQVTQASNQLLGVLAQQGVSLQQIYAASAQLQTHMAMRDLATYQQAQQNAQAFMQGYGQEVFRGPRHGEGFELPR